jgi:hypothetical protein
MIARPPFNREDHIFRSPELESLLKDAIRFFNGTPIYELPPPENFIGSGIYSIYYTGNLQLYAPLSAVNRIQYALPIYVGKAIPIGARRGQTGTETNSLYRRLRDHASSIRAVNNLELTHFHCRFVIVPHEENTLISSIESAIIRQYNPLWNSCIDGFGNHDPGGGRTGQARSQWDVIHPGRKWAERLQGIMGENDPDTIFRNIGDYFERLTARGRDEI